MVCGILTVLLGLNLYSKWDKPRFALLLFMLTAALLYWGHSIYFYHQMKLITLSDTIYSFCNPAVFPLFFIYIEELTRRQTNHLRQFAYLLPSTVCCVAVGTLYALMDDAETHQFIDQHLYRNDYSSLEGMAWWQGLVHMVIKIIFALEIPPILVLSWRYIKQYNLTIENYYSNTEGKLLSKIHSLLILFTAAAFISFIFNIIGRYQFANSFWLLLLPSALFSTLLILIGHVGLHQQFTIKDIIAEEKDQDPRPSSTISQDKLSDSIKRLVVEERLYLQPNLKLDDLAKRLNTNRNYVYQAINIKMGVSFTYYINQKRIEYAVQQMEENPKALLTDIAQKSGFTSTSAFYRNFKTLIGCSPKEYLQSL